MDDLLHVGRPNIGDRAAFFARVEAMFERRWLSNDGPFVREFEAVVCSCLGVRHAVALCNATVGLEVASKALGFADEVIVPSFTFVATAHALQWQGIKPVFCDIDPATHNLDPGKVRDLITPRTSGIVGVHTWGRPCDTAAIEEVARENGLKVMYDASHAFGCSAGDRMVGGFGECEVFSFHATKFINCFEGGVVTTNHDELAAKMRLMRNFGFKGFDNVVYLGVNGKMSEISAAMGLTNLEAMEDIVAVNRRNHCLYCELLHAIPGLSVLRLDEGGRSNFQYVVLEVDSTICGRTRDAIVEALHAENVIARKYFWPGCHRMEPYRTMEPEAWKRLPQTEHVASRVIVLPTGQSVDEATVQRVCHIIRRAIPAREV